MALCIFPVSVATFHFTYFVVWNVQFQYAAPTSWCDQINLMGSQNYGLFYVWPWPCRAAREEREKRRGSTATPSPEKDTPTQQSETCQTTSPTNSEGKEERIVPQLRIGTDGNIIIDEARYVCRCLVVQVCIYILYNWKFGGCFNLAIWRIIPKITKLMLTQRYCSSSHAWDTKLKTAKSVQMAHSSNNYNYPPNFSYTVSVNSHVRISYELDNKFVVLGQV